MIDDFWGVRKNESTPCCYCSAPPNTLNKRYGYTVVYDRCYSTDLYEIDAQEVETTQGKKSKKIREKNGFPNRRNGEDSAYRN